MGVSFEISLRNRTETLATHASVRYALILFHSNHARLMYSPNVLCDK